MGKCGPLIENLCLRDFDLIALKFAWVDDPWKKLDGFLPFFLIVDVKEN